jgi:predicted Zn-dependent protease
VIDRIIASSDAMDTEFALDTEGSTSYTKALMARRGMVLGLGSSAVILGACQTGTIAIGKVKLNPGQLANAAVSVFEGLNMSEKDELEIGRKMYGPMIDQSGGAYKNRRVQGAMDRFAQPFFEASSRKTMNWEVTVLDDNTVNAWAMPGGKLAVNKGLLRYVANEHELAAVMAHEVGHIEREHSLKAMRLQKFQGAGGDVIKSAVSSNTGGSVAGTMITDQVMKVLGPLIGKLITSGYSKSNEFEADAYILDSFAKTGHDPIKAPDFFRTLLQLIPPGQTNRNSLFSTHPDTKDRIAKLVEDGQKQPKARRKAASPAFNKLRQTFPLRQHYRRSTTSS